jgi:hypothetical protein
MEVSMPRDGKRGILPRRVPGSVRGVRAARSTWVFQTETRVVADVTGSLWEYMEVVKPESYNA